MERTRIVQAKYKEILDDYEQKLDLWKKYRRDYETLHTKLEDLPNKLSYDIMVCDYMVVIQY